MEAQEAKVKDLQRVEVLVELTSFIEVFLKDDLLERVNEASCLPLRAALRSDWSVWAAGAFIS